MAARAHWFEDEDASAEPPSRGGQPDAGGGRCCGNPRRVRRSGLIDERADRARPRADLHPHAPHGRARRADPAGARSGRRGRARRPRPGAGPRRVDRRRPRRARRRERQGQAEGRAGPRVQDERRRRSPPISASGSRRALRQAALDRLGMEARAGNADQRRRPDRDRRPRRQGPLADPRRRCRRGRQPQARPGLAGRRRSEAATGRG